MGSGGYDFDARAVRAAASGYATASAHDATVFKQAASRTINQGMDPAQITVRECRDNADHPNTVPVILALDVTGSMGSIPVQLIKDDLPRMMSRLLCFHPDIALMFMAVGDHECDRGPLQVGQFEASDELLDHWLQHTWIEGGGGANPGESYALPWMFAATSVVTDAWEKRQQKGLLITIGDEPNLGNYNDPRLARFLGDQSSRIMGQFQDGLSKDNILRKCEEQWEVHHIAMRPLDQTWTILGDRFHQIPKTPYVSGTVSEIVEGYLTRLGIMADNAQHEAEPEPNTPPPAAPPAGTIPDPI